MSQVVISAPQVCEKEKRKKEEKEEEEKEKKRKREKKEKERERERNIEYLPRMPCLSAKEPGHRAAVPNSTCEIGRGWEVVDVGLQQEAFKMWGLADVMEVDSLTCIKNRTKAG